MSRRNRENNLPEPSIENIPDSPEISSAEQTAEMVMDQAQTTKHAIETSAISPERKKSLLDKLQRATVRTLRLLTTISVFSAAAGITDYKLTRYTTVESNQEFRHQDEETTHILNVLSGKEPLNEPEKLQIVRHRLKYYFINMEKAGRSIDNGLIDSIDSLTLSAALALARTRIFAPDFNNPNISNEEMLNILVPSLSLAEFDPQLYNGLWKIEQQCGNPKIRWLNTQIDHQPGIMPRGGIYASVTNTLYLRYNHNIPTINSLLHEEGHASRMNQSPVTDTWEGIRDYATIAYSAVASGENFSVAQRKLYKTPGSSEYAADQTAAQHHHELPNRTQLTQTYEAQRTSDRTKWKQQYDTLRTTLSAEEFAQQLPIEIVKNAFLNNDNI